MTSTPISRFACTPVTMKLIYQYLKENGSWNNIELKMIKKKRNKKNRRKKGMKGIEKRFYLKIEYEYRI